MTAFGLVAMVCAALLAASAREPRTVTLDAARFGAVGNGIADDGPAIARLLEAAARERGPLRLRFGADRTYRVRTAPDRYVFRLRGVSDWTLDGGGSTFLLDPHVRFLDVTGSRRVAVRRLRVDFDPLPFADGTVTAVDAARRRITVRLHADRAERLAGGPTRQDGEQAFFAMLWHEGPYGQVSRHCWVERMEPGYAPDVVHLAPDPGFREYADIVPGQWRISLPVPGIAHRFGPGACVRVHENDTVTMEDVEVWSAPWFAFDVARNAGMVTFRRVHIRPKPGSGRLMSVWRDGFHVKSNRATMLWEDCELTGMNDDAFNISTHTSVVEEAPAPTQIVVRQKFPLGFVPWRAGATLAAADERARRRLGQARIVRAVEGPAPPPIEGQPAAPRVTIELDRPIEGLGPGAMVWDPEQTNPRTTIRRCRIAMSCRLQSPVTIEASQVTALLWFYGEPVEGPFPSRVRLLGNDLRRGRGNPTHAVVFSGAPDPDAGPGADRPPRAIHNVTIRGNAIRGGFVLVGAEHVRLEHNRFLEPGAPVLLSGNHGMRVRGNVDAAGRPVP
ncbi:MAG TPA: hypothetical protein VLH79_13315 [Chthonomonadales bacterium]|nr:hypothetical protein [Chthonomonadales bacterium]